MFDNLDLDLMGTRRLGSFYAWALESEEGAVRTTLLIKQSTAGLLAWYTASDRDKSSSGIS